MISEQSIVKKNVLVIDPDQDFCQNMRLYLEDNYNVLIRQTLDYLDYAILLNKVDLLIVEADFADENLVVLLEKLKRDHPSIKILIMYIYFPTDKMIEKAIASDADDLIAKPFDVAQLKSKVDQLLLGVRHNDGLKM